MKRKIYITERQADMLVEYNAKDLLDGDVMKPGLGGSEVSSTVVLSDNDDEEEFSEPVSNDDQEEFVPKRGSFYGYGGMWR